MDPENNFDSDTSESWSLIDINCDQYSDNNIDDAGGENQFQGVINGKESPSSAGDHTENRLPGKITREADGVATPCNNLKNQEHLQLLFKSRAFDESEVGKKSEPNTEEGEKVDHETKDLDEDTDGISVISESEYNDMKSANYESDEDSDKGSDSDGGENQIYNGSRRKKKMLKTNQEECCEETANLPTGRGMINSVLTITVGLTFALVACVAVGQFLGVHDSQEAAISMVQALKKLQNENFMLHARLRQISEAVFGKPSEGHEMMGKSLPCEDHDADCIRAKLAKPENRVGEDDTPLSFFRHRDNIDLSIPLHHPKNLVILQEILSGNEVLVLRKPDELVEPFNLTKYIKDLIRAQQIKIDDPETMGKGTGLLNNVRPSTKGPAKAGEDGKKLELNDGEDMENVEKSNGKGCQKDSAKVEDGEKRKENCLAIREKDLSEFRWFLLNGKPKCTDTEMESGENGCSSDYFYKLPVDEGYSKQSSEGLDELKTIIQKHNVLLGRNREPKPAPSDKSVGYLFPTKLKSDVDEYGDAKLRNKYLQFPKQNNDSPDVTVEKVVRDESEKKPKRSGFEIVRKDHFLYSGEFVDKYLKHFKSVADDVRKNNGKMKECVKKDGEKCGVKSKKKKRESNSSPNENRKKYKEKSARDDGERRSDKKDNKEQKAEQKNRRHRKSDKKHHGESGGDGKDHVRNKAEREDHVPDGSKVKTKSKTKKLRTCGINAGVKCGNESKCANCSEKSGDWFSRWAESRERHRRDQKISDWQFERAKSRAHSRVGDAFWQFTRADGRQSRRMYPYTRKRKVRQQPRKGYNFKSHSWE